MSFAKGRRLSKWRRRDDSLAPPLSDLRRAPERSAALAAPESLPSSRVRRTRPRRTSVALTFPVGPIARDEIQGLCDELRDTMVVARTRRFTCDVQAIRTPDAAVVEALARLQLTARRLGCEVRLVHASPELRWLVAFMGLSGVLPCDQGSRRGGNPNIGK